MIVLHHLNLFFMILTFFFLFSLLDAPNQGISSNISSQQPSVAPVRQINENQILPTDRFTETDIKELTSLGFTREQVVSELRRFNGDKTQATAALFAKSLKF